MPVKEGELVRYDPYEGVFEAKYIEDEAERESRRTIGYYAMFELINGYRRILYWSFEKMLHHADEYSKAFSAKAYEKLLAGEVPQKEMWKYSSFWYKDFDGMACKTMLISVNLSDNDMIRENRIIYKIVNSFGKGFKEFHVLFYTHFPIFFCSISLFAHLLRYKIIGKRNKRCI